ncbi:SprT-like domain-containing protein [Naasia lichenicola]|uniref:SprT family zinc-dependent metalloprotease n=1 Tax=Naasia lichenicola TaxID=2565933 RepID=A0A4S4FHS1_9MICO|nr:SprT-like domain-containing protein [Naasia lichenicola]THG29641.1 SprT family zinc-dependent metalloprotease [Naasia lichenicola]
MSDLDRVRRWAAALIDMHLDPSWSFGFDTAKRRAGLCNYSAKRITVSRYLAEKYEDDDIHQVLLHEVAHAMAGHQAAHGAKWLTTARAIGYIGDRLHDGESAIEMATWIGTCPGGHTHYRYRKPTGQLSCAICGRGFSQKRLITWKPREPEARPQRRSPSTR